MLLTMLLQFINILMQYAVIQMFVLLMFCVDNLPTLFKTV